MNSVEITKDIQVGSGQPLLLFAGPCQLESIEHSLMIAEELKRIVKGLPISLVFKGSFDKANRTSVNSKRGPGLEEGLRILSEVKKKIGVPLITDVHLPDQASKVAKVVDVLQIPAFLCRQTDLLLAAGETGKPVHIKKAQFMAAADMKHSAAKIEHTGNSNILLCERGTCLGYHDLVVDMRNLCIMRSLGYPVIFDATHSVQVMGGAKGVSGGHREYIAPLAYAATAVGIDGLFIECHQDPDHAPSDAACMLPLPKVRGILETVCRIREAVTGARHDKNAKSAWTF